MPPSQRSGPTRRDFLRGAAVGTLAGSVLGQAEAQSTDASAPVLSGQVHCPLTVNGRAVTLVVEPRTTLLDALRDGHLVAGDPVDHTGAKRVCDRGTCGACTVLLDGEPVYACSLLAVDATGHEITTIEGLSPDGVPTALQQAFVEHDALMCGFCTPGFVTAAAALLKSNPTPTREEIQHALSGNLCRCGTYHRIFEAVADAAGRSGGER